MCLYTSHPSAVLSIRIQQIQTFLLFDISVCMIPRKAVTSYFKENMVVEKQRFCIIFSKNWIFLVDVFTLSEIGFIARIHEMTMKSGSDAQACLHSLFRNCVDMAPSVLLIDPLQEIAADNPNRRINRSDVDQALLSELRHILEEAKSSGVTIIGITTQENSCLSRVVRAFDEKIGFFSPSQQDRIAYFRHLINHFVDMSSTKIDPSRFAEYLSLHSFIFIISFHIDLLSLGQILIIVSEMQ